MIESKLLEKLNSEQIKAVTHKKGPLLIIAGAGTGKTKVITHRIAWLIEQKLARPEEILALTFTEKSAAEMEERVDILVPYGYIDTWISTFHAFGDRILRDNYLEIGIDGAYEVLTKNDQMIWLKNHLFEFPLEYFRPLSNPQKHIEALISFISRCKDELISPDDYRSYALTLKNKAQTNEEKIEAKKHFELAQFYRFYQELLIQEGKFDFGDLILKTIELFNSRSDILQKYQNQFKYILVDEFQDTNFAQNKLIKILAKKNKNITVVGDDDQSIYKFRGAAISNILDFKKVFINSEQVILTQNYRSSQEILDSAYQLIKNNNPDRLEIKNNINKKLLAQFNDENPQSIFTNTHNEEIKSVIEKIIELNKNKTIPLSQIAILARANDHLEPFIQELAKKKINYLFSGDRGLAEMPEIKLIISLIKVLGNPLDTLAHYQIMISEFYNFNVWELNKITGFAKINNHKLLFVLENIDLHADDLNISQPTIQKIINYIDDLKKYNELSKQRSGGQLIYQFLSDKKFLHKLLKIESVQNEIKIKNIAKLFQKIKSWEKFEQDNSILTLAENIKELEKYSLQNAEIAANDFDAVNLLTVHSAKGLEFEAVFMIDLVQDRFPTRRKKEPLELPQNLIKEKLPEGDFHLQEERRLFYVGLTRAKRYLFLCFAQDYGGIRLKKPSLFVSEALGKQRIELTNNNNDYISEIENFKLPFENKELKLKIESMYRGKKLYLNPHKIDDYLTCPLKFKYIHILEIPVLKYHHVVYGRAIHEALKFYFDNKLKGIKVTIKQLIKIFKNNWDSEGFESRTHEEKRFQKGIETLEKYYIKQELKNTLPSFVEKSFKFDLDNITIKGRFDIIYEHEGNIEISDFKTSEIETQDKANKRARESNQLAIYALAWQKIEKQLPKNVSLDFIESGITGIYEVKQKRIEKILNDIKKVSTGIEKIDFSANSSFNNCHYCAYKTLCPRKHKKA